MSLECPCCGAEIDDPDDKYEPSVQYEHECPKCGKYFVFEIEYERIYSATQAPCLNGGEHDYKEVRRYGSRPEVLIFQRCANCGHEVHNVEFRPLDAASSRPVAPGTQG